MFKSNWARLLIPATMASFGANVFAADYQVDVSHSKVGFSVRHMMVGKVHGRFKEFEGKFSFDPDKGTVSNTNFVVKVPSIDTDDAKRDDHLRNEDFFNAEKFPTMTLTNSKLTKKGKDKYKWAGDLTIRGVTKPVVFDLEFVSPTKDPWGNNRAGFSANTRINRKDFGMTWNKTLDAGGLAVGDEVDIQIDVEAIEAKAPTETKAPKAKN